MALNLGDGRFLDISGVSGADSVTDGRGSAFADFDNDGDLDIFLSAMHGPAHLLFHNRVGQDSKSVRVSLQGTRSGRDAFGAVVRVKTSAGVLTQIKSGGGGFLSQSDPRLVFGLGDDDGATWMEVSWPSGLKQRFDGPPAGASVLVVEGEDAPRRLEERRFSLPKPLSALQERFGMVRVSPRQPLPEIAVKELDGRRRLVAEVIAPGRPVLLNFWATWCKRCAAELPGLQRLHARGGTDGPLVVGICVDERADGTAIAEFAKRAGVTYPVYTIDRGELAKLFVARDVGVPVSILLDAELRAVDVFGGWSSAAQARLDELTGAARSQ